MDSTLSTPPPAQPPVTSSNPPLNATMNPSPADPKPKLKRTPLWTYLPLRTLGVSESQNTTHPNPFFTPTSTLASNGNPKSNSMSLLTPVDKPSTSWRILLADTQSQLQKFSGRVDGLLKTVEDVKMRVGEVEGRWESGFEAPRADVGDLMDRSQRMVLQTMGNPVQISMMESVLKDVDSTERRLEALDRRVDVLHLLTQTQAQSLQTLLENQTTVLTTLAAVLPLIQTLPVHVDKMADEVRAEVKEVVGEARREVRELRGETKEGLKEVRDAMLIQLREDWDEIKESFKREVKDAVGEVQLQIGLGFEGVKGSVGLLGTTFEEVGSNLGHLREDFGAQTAELHGKVEELGPRNSVIGRDKASTRTCPVVGQDREVHHCCHHSGLKSRE
ncbi:hypothetical protein JAAARDRAFT_211744 [Jaapia argillacea MUCL 33604]|uniref:Uncharacterized protein n=1 Tax=Jaapia argillacea MUCL 33604 TaxID=933084 RepID=A0A067P9H3_9AGAM|nr:hypothetical protein JAAARDRAFT_211744 [Jaapia argillacea MUCL 33604]